MAMLERKQSITKAEAPIVFVAGPYFATEHDLISRNIQEAITAGQELFKRGFLALVVHNHTHHFEQKTKVEEPVYRAFDRLVLEKSVDAIICLPNWRTSQGARIEVHHMLSLKKPVFEAFDDLVAWRDGKHYPEVTVVTLSERDQEVFDESVPEIKVVFTIGPYATLKEGRRHHKCVLSAEDYSVVLWNAGFPAFSRSDALRRNTSLLTLRVILSDHNH